MKYYSALKKNEILPSATACMDLKGIRLSKMSDRKENAIWSHLYAELKNKRQNRDHKYRELTGRCQKLEVGKWEGGQNG